MILKPLFRLSVWLIFPIFSMMQMFRFVAKYLEASVNRKKVLSINSIPERKQGENKHKAGTEKSDTGGFKKKRSVVEFWSDSQKERRNLIYKFRTIWLITGSSTTLLRKETAVLDCLQTTKLGRLFSWLHFWLRIYQKYFLWHLGWGIKHLWSYPIRVFSRLTKVHAVSNPLKWSQVKQNRDMLTCGMYEADEKQYYK